MPTNNMSFGDIMYSLVANQGRTPLVNYNFMLRVEGAIDVPCRSVRVFQKENEFEYIQEGGLNDYVHMRRKPITKPFTFQVERYVGIEIADPMSNGTEFILPLVLFVTRFPISDAKALGAGFSRMYTFTGAVVMAKEFGELVGDRSGLLVETTTIGYREMMCIDNPAFGYSSGTFWGFDQQAGKRAPGAYEDISDTFGNGQASKWKGEDSHANTRAGFLSASKATNYSSKLKWDFAERKEGVDQPYMDVNDKLGDGSSILYKGKDLTLHFARSAKGYESTTKEQNYKKGKPFKISDYKEVTPYINPVIQPGQEIEKKFYARRNPTEQPMEARLKQARKWDYLQSGSAASYQDISDKDGDGTATYYLGKKENRSANTSDRFQSKSTKKDNYGNTVRWKDTGPAAGAGTYTDISDKKGDGSKEFFLGKDKKLIRTNSIKGFYKSKSKNDNYKKGKPFKISDYQLTIDDKNHVIQPGQGAVPFTNTYAVRNPSEKRLDDHLKEVRKWDYLQSGSAASYQDISDKDGDGTQTDYLGKEESRSANKREGFQSKSTKKDNYGNTVRWYDTGPGLGGDGPYTDISDEDGNGFRRLFLGRDFKLIRANSIDGFYKSKSKSDNYEYGAKRRWGFTAASESDKGPYKDISDNGKGNKKGYLGDEKKRSANKNDKYKSRSKADSYEKREQWENVGPTTGGGIYTDISDRKGNGLRPQYKGKEAVHRANSIDGLYSSTSKNKNYKKGKTELWTLNKGGNNRDINDDNGDGRSDKYQGGGKKNANKRDGYKSRSKAESYKATEKWENAREKTKTGGYTDISDELGNGIDKRFLGTKLLRTNSIKGKYQSKSKSENYGDTKLWSFGEGGNYRDVSDKNGDGSSTKYLGGTGKRYANKNGKYVSTTKSKNFADKVQWQDMGQAAGGGKYSDISDKDGDGSRQFFLGKTGLVRRNNIADCFISTKKSENYSKGKPWKAKAGADPIHAVTNPNEKSKDEMISQARKYPPTRSARTLKDFLNGN